jgi:type I restriction enzyme M protein
MTQNGKNTRDEVRTLVKNASDDLRSDGVQPRNYVEQLTWLFFLKAFDQQEDRHEEEAAFNDEPYKRRLTGEFAWSAWSKLTTDPKEMLTFVNDKLWSKLTSQDPEVGLGEDGLAQRFRRIFETVKNYSRTPSIFSSVVQQVDKLDFSSQEDVDVLGLVYEDLLKDVAGDSAGFAGEFYTPRHLVNLMVKVADPQPGDGIYDPCFGSAGFLTQAVDHIRKNSSLSGQQMEHLQSQAIGGIEFQPLSFLLGNMNLILRGIEAPNLELGNTLELHETNVKEADKYRIILANPPYGGKAGTHQQVSFRIRSGKTETLFMQHIMGMLAKGGKAAVVVPEGTMFRGGAEMAVRKELIENFNLHTILSLPSGVFQPYAAVKTNIIFFDRPKNEGESTKSIWYYELTNDGFGLTSTRKPIEGSQVDDFLSKWKDRTEGENSWICNLDEIIERDYDISAKNPNIENSTDERTPLEIVESIKSNQVRIGELINEIQNVLES